MKSKEKPLSLTRKEIALIKVMRKFNPEQRKTICNLLEEPKFLETLLRSNSKQIKTFINLVEDEAQRKSFTVGEIFKQGPFTKYYDDIFEKSLENAKDDDFSFNPSVENFKSYIWKGRNLKDSQIEEELSNKGFMTERQYWILMYILIINPELRKNIFSGELIKGKFYISHIKLVSGKTVYRTVESLGDMGLIFKENDFNKVTFWPAESVFIYPGY